MAEIVSHSPTMQPASRSTRRAYCNVGIVHTLLVAAVAAETLATLYPQEWHKPWLIGLRIAGLIAYLAWRHCCDIPNANRRFYQKARRLFER